MNTAIERLRIDGCDAFSVSAAFIAMEGAGYVRKKYTPTSDVSHLEVYQYLSPGGEKISVVYDTVAKILTADAPADALSALRPMLPAGAPKPAKQPPAKQAADKPKANASGALPAVSHGRSPALSGKRVPAVSGKRVPMQRDVPVPAKQQKKPVKKNPPPARVTEKLKGIARKRLEWALKDMKSADGIKVTAHMGGSSWTLTDAAKNVAELRIDGDAVSVTGTANPLVKLIRDRLTSKCDMRLLRKYLSSVSLRYLSEASRLDLSNGLTDIANVPRLSDYSVLLITPYRALEKLIYDLQQAEGINVKMIGQAYEKDDEGRYTLKKGYRKRINSVVYSEVMAALYTEYYVTRNFYTHAENAADSRSRGISDKAEAQKILRNLLAVIDYNCKKLSEIGFAISEE